jgi:hypothetical protein
MWFEWFELIAQTAVNSLKINFRGALPTRARDSLGKLGQFYYT